MIQSNSINNYIDTRREDEIIDWYNNLNESTYNIISHPLYDLSHLKNILIYLINGRRKILYITNNESFVRFQLIKLFNNDRLVNKIVFLNSSKQVLNDKFDLLIFDDLSGVSLIQDNDIISSLDKYRNVGKRIILSMSSLNIVPSIYVLSQDFKRFKEPRYIQTKMDLNFDMPNVVFDFLKWFIQNEGKVILITKDRKSKHKVYEYLNKYKNLYDKFENVFLDDGTDGFLNFSLHNNVNSYIYVTTNSILNELGEYRTKYNIFNDDFNVVVFFADNKNFNYKNLLYLCSCSNFLQDNPNEVIFVSKDENMEIIKTKTFARDYNRRVWEWEALNY